MNFITLKELKKMVPVASEFKRVPGLKKILEDGIEVVLRKQMENHAEVVVYKNGYVSYHAAAYRAARAMGYNKVITYILDTENGSSLKAAGYTCEGRAGGLEWNGVKAPKQADQYPRQMKTRWVKKKEGLHGS
jgi:phosphoribosyl-ATP pyrophosphohydrolase